MSRTKLTLVSVEAEGGCIDLAALRGLLTRGLRAQVAQKEDSARIAAVLGAIAEVLPSRCAFDVDLDGARIEAGWQAARELGWLEVTP